MQRKPLLIGAAVCAVSCAQPTPPDPQYTAQWLRSSLSFVRSERLGPPVASRISAYGALALYEGYASEPTSGLRSLGGQLNGLTSLPQAPAGGVDGATVAAEAMRVVLDSLFRDGFASTRRAIETLAAAQVEGRRAAGVGKDMSDRSAAHGRSLGAAILAWAATDGFFDTRRRAWTAPKTREQWENTVTQDQFVPLMLSGESDLVAPTNP
ncbi:MAG: hypothetical protein ACREOG_02810, partial [Gemmatimonadaceae bacterium]